MFNEHICSRIRNVPDKTSTDNVIINDIKAESGLYLKCRLKIINIGPWVDKLNFQ